jgi:dienelactone hydrolase
MARVPAEVDGFRLIERRAGAPWSWPVYRGGEGPPVVIMHEVFGLSTADLAFARRVCDEGFTVWLPVLAGPVPSATRCDALRAGARVCISSEITKLWTGRTSPIVTPLRALARYARQEGGTRGVGVVGMCMSGGFAIAMAADDAVLAAVAAEPALPFSTKITPWCAKDPGVSPDDLARISERLGAGTVALLVTRFTEDRKSPHRRVEALRAGLGTTGLTVEEIPSGPKNPFGFPEKAHSVLSDERLRHALGTPGGDRLESTVQEIVGLLRARIT